MVVKATQTALQHAPGVAESGKDHREERSALCFFAAIRHLTGVGWLAACSCFQHGPAALFVPSR